MFTSSGSLSQLRRRFQRMASRFRQRDEVIDHERTLIGPLVEVPVADWLAEECMATVHGPRQAAVTTLKNLRKREWERMGAAYLERINEVTGFDTALGLTSVVDAILCALFQRALRVSQAPEDWSASVGVFAIGGYGRAEFNPYSDIDVLVLSDSARIADWVKAVNAEFQTLMWDCGFQVGASMRSLGELENIIKDDFVTATAVLEHRPLLADEHLSDGMHGLLQRFRDQRSREFLRYKIEEVQSRREITGSSIFVMEPNLKTSPGGLRDIQFLRNLAFVLFGSRTLHALREMDTIEADDVQLLFAANDHLLGLRSLQHFHHGHRQDQFLLADQLRCAQQLGFGSRQSLRDVELLMRDHYRKTVMVDQVVRLTIDRVRSLGLLGNQKPIIASRRALCDGFAVIEGQVYLAQRSFLQSPQYCQRILTMARQAQLQRLRISLNVQRSIAHLLSSSPHVIQRDASCARLFLEILGEGGRVAPILRDLHGAGFLGAYVPEFGKITCHMQFDAYHQYTVDEHTLIAIEYLDAIASCADGVPSVLQQLYLNLRRHDLLALSLLLHDVGKFMGSGHVARGELMVGPVCRRLGLNEDEQDLVRFLVGEHVLLSNISRSRDLSDQQFLDAMAQRIGSVERLDMLYLLTWPDAKAVGPKMLSGWQESLLEECYLKLRAVLNGRAQAPAGRKQALIDCLQGAGLSDEEIADFLRRMPEDYPHQVLPVESARWHYHVLASAGQDPISAAMYHHDHGDDWTIVVVLPDRVNLLADVAAVCSGHGLDIQACRVWLTTDKQAMLSLRVNSLMPGRWRDPDAWGRLQAAITPLAHASVDHEALAERRRKMIAPEPRADSLIDDVEVKIDDVTSEQTILDVRTKDRPGLLAMICQIIADQGCRIDFAQIATQGDQAVDVFYVTTGGEKLHPLAARELCQALHQALV